MRGTPTVRQVRDRPRRWQLPRCYVCTGWSAPWALLCALLAGTAASSSLDRSYADAIQSRLESRSTDPQISALQSFYAPQHFGPVWSRSGQPTRQALQLIGALEAADTVGLDAQAYAAGPLRAEATALNSQTAAGEIAEFDVRLSANALAYLHDAHFGRVDAVQMGFSLPQSRRRPFDAPVLLSSFTQSQDVPASLASVEPQYLHYTLLKRALARYETLPRLPGILAPPIVPKIGGAFAQAPALRSVLIAFGDLPSTQAVQPLVFDIALAQALKEFKRRHGLSADSRLDAPALAAIAVPTSVRIDQIKLTLERWRWVPEFSAPPIIVNIPQFRLFAFGDMEDRKASILQMDVIVGRTFPATHTPIFTADMRQVIFRPFWQVPYGIVKKEMIPKLAKDPDYLSREALQIVAQNDETSPPIPISSGTLVSLAAGHLKLRQAPGAHNALGLVKFSLPNPYDVYLHSTPTPALFQQVVRAFSHGCIRVSDPVAQPFMS